MKIKLKNGKLITVAIQQYQVGLYVCIYDDDTGRMLDQFGLDVSENDFLKDVQDNKVFDGIYQSA